MEETLNAMLEAEADRLCKVDRSYATGVAFNLATFLLDRTAANL